MKNKSVFYIRAVLTFILFLVPPAYLIFKYKLFQEVSAMTIGGWGIICIALVFVGLYIFLKSVVSGIWTYWKQCVKGVLFILLPFSCVFFIVYLSRNYLDELMQVLIISMFSYFSAYLINPYPEYNLVEQDRRQASVFNKVLDNRTKKD